MIYYIALLVTMNSSILLYKEYKQWKRVKEQW
jgi:hypothetical protein